MARLPDGIASRMHLVRDYAAAISGSAGRLVFSLVYFVVLANTLTISEFGLFATASGAGVMLSRILGFGFVAPLYRIATVRPGMVGVYSGGFLLASLASLPALALAALLTHRAFFGAEMALPIFLAVIVAEVLLWRPVEVTVIVRNGMQDFAAASILVIIGTLLRAGAAFGFSLMASTTDLATWTLWYLGANAIALAIALVGFYPRRRIRFRPALYWPKVADSLYVAAAEILFYLQMEMDKLLVLALGGPRLAGIYAIVMRLVDLTAIPIRTFTMMLIQRMMKLPEILARLGTRVGIEAGVFAVSTLALAALAIILHFQPTLLGENVAEVAPLLAFALLVPGFRNLIEYEAELLFARGQTLARAINLALLAGLKALLLAFLLVNATEPQQIVLWLNPIFLTLYVASALLSYSAIRLPARKI